MLTYVVASKCYRNHFISKKYKTTQSSKLHSRQNSSLGQRYISASDRKSVGNISGNHFVKSFSALPSQSYWRHYYHQSAVFSVLISVEGKLKISCNQLRRVWGMLQCCHIVLCYEIHNWNRPVCWNMVVKEKPAVDSPFFGGFPSDRVPKATTDVRVHSFIYSLTFRVELVMKNALAVKKFCKLYRRIPWTFLKLLRIY